MQPELQLFNLYNTLCLSAMALASFTVWRRNRSPFFRAWLVAAGCGVGLSASELVATFTGRALALDVLEFALAAATAWWLFQAARAFTGEGHGPARGTAAAMATALALAVGLRLGGVPYEAACLPAVVAYFWGYAYLAARLLRAGRRPGEASPRLLAWAIVGFALVSLSYPALQGSPHLWVGFALTGLLQFMMGLGVVVYVLESDALRLAAQNETLQRLDGLKDQLLANVSHELRTPITAIKTAVFMLAEDAARLPPDQAELLAIIDRSNDQLARRVADMIDYSLIDSGLLHYDRRPVDLRGVVAEATEPFRPGFGAKGVAFAVEAPPMPVMAVVDHHRLAQVVENLLGNALKFTPAGGEVRMSLREASAEAVIEVRDTGEGVAEDLCHRIFERHFQAPTHGARRANGIGLGLAIVRAIIEDGHGGRVGVAANAPRGSVFTVAVPLAR